MRQGQMDPYYNDIVKALDRDGYDGAISLESVYTPEGGTREDGFRESLPIFMEPDGKIIFLNRSVIVLKRCWAAGSCLKLRPRHQPAPGSSSPVQRRRQPDVPK